MNNAVFGKTMGNKRKHRVITLAERRTNYLVSEPNLDVTKFFKEKLPAIQTKKTGILMNKPACLRLSILK